MIPGAYVWNELFNSLWRCVTSEYDEKNSMFVAASQLDKPVYSVRLNKAFIKIPVTEEILKHCFGKKISSISNLYVINKDYALRVEADCVVLVGRYLYCSQTVDLKKMKYVHELQQALDFFDLNPITITNKLAKDAIQRR